MTSDMVLSCVPPPTPHTHTQKTQKAKQTQYPLLCMACSPHDFQLRIITNRYYQWSTCMKNNNGCDTSATTLQYCHLQACCPSPTLASTWIVSYHRASARQRRATWRRCERASFARPAFAATIASHFEIQIGRHMHLPYKISLIMMVQRLQLQHKFVKPQSEAKIHVRQIVQHLGNRTTNAFLRPPPPKERVGGGYDTIFDRHATQGWIGRWWWGAR